MKNIFTILLTCTCVCLLVACEDKAEKRAKLEAQKVEAFRAAEKCFYVAQNKNDEALCHKKHEEYEQIAAELDKLNGVKSKN